MIRVGELFKGSIADRLKGFKCAHQRFAAGRADPLDIVENRVHLSLATQAAVVLDGEAVRLVLNPRDEPEAFRADVDRYLDIIVIQTAGTVKIILDHTADRNRNAKLIKDAQGYVDLPRPPSIMMRSGNRLKLPIS